MKRTPQSNGYRKYAIGGAAVALAVAVIAVVASWPRQMAVSEEGRMVLKSMQNAADGLERGSDQQYATAAAMLDAYLKSPNAEACPLFVSALKPAGIYLKEAARRLEDGPAIPEMAVANRQRISESIAEARKWLDKAAGQLDG